MPKKKTNKGNSASKKKEAPAPIPFPRGFRDRRTAVEKAQDVIYDGWDVDMPDPVAVAKKALSISPDCADAYNLLADAAESLEQITELYRQGVAAGERALGKAFKGYVGHFWGFLETRPYMRARAGLAQCLWELGKCDEAIAHYQDMLHLNPNDNQGIRDLLMACLLKTSRLEEAEALHKQYKDDCMATWAYSRALIDFRKGGDSAKARKSLTKALETNKFVPAYLTGKKKLPTEMPEYYGFGDDNEAVLYAEGNIESWKMTPGALEWLAATAK